MADAKDVRCRYLFIHAGQGLGQHQQQKDGNGGDSTNAAGYIAQPATSPSFDKIVFVAHFPSITNKNNRIIKFQRNFTIILKYNTIKYNGYINTNNNDTNHSVTCCLPSEINVTLHPIFEAGTPFSLTGTNASTQSHNIANESIGDQYVYTFTEHIKRIFSKNHLQNAYASLLHMWKTDEEKSTSSGSRRRRETMEVD